MAQQVVFYSWQSWTDAGANRSFIEDCLERAIKEIRKDDCHESEKPAAVFHRYGLLSLL